MKGLRALPPENVYGHTKKLRYILDCIDSVRARSGGRCRVLDFGCGNGAAVSQYLIGEGIEYVGVEEYPPCLEHARAMFGGPHATFVEAVPSRGEFDVIVYADVLEHLDAPDRVLAHHRTLLAEQGIVVGSVPNGYGPFENESRLDRWFGLQPRFHAALRRGRAIKHAALGTKPPAAVDEPPLNHGSIHVQFFTKRALVRTLARGGLELSDFRNGSFVGASISGYFLRGPRVLAGNTSIADHLPSWAVSTWYFTAVKSPALVRETKLV